METNHHNSTTLHGGQFSGDGNRRCLVGVGTGTDDWIDAIVI